MDDGTEPRSDQASPGRPGRRAFALDLLLFAALMAFSVPVTMQAAAPDGAGAGTVWDTILLPTVAAALFVRHRAPLAATAVLAAGCVVSGIPTFSQFRLAVAIPVGMVCAFTVASRCERRAALAGLGFVLAGMLVVGATDVVLVDSGGVVAMAAFSFPLCGGMWGTGRLVRSRDLLADELAARSALLERQREQTAQLAVEIERTRLASELDVAARDHVREMIGLVDTGERALAEDPLQTREAFAQIERKSRQALNEMRGLLGVLRSDERGGRSPRPTLAQLETLLADARAGGRVVQLDIEGERRTLPGGLELAVYRALQHALVAVQGRQDAPARVQLRYLPGAVELEVSGRPIEGPGADAAMLAARERVVAQGGSFSADTSTGRPAPRRTLRAHLPLVAAGV